ncbi:hypothetical protein ACFL5Z_11050 [Planctomycetota bacterium]
MCRRFILLTSFVLVLCLTGRVVCADPFTQDPGPDGIVSMEAENFDENTPFGINEWIFVTEPAGFSGDGAMQNTPATPLTGGGPDADYADASPRLDFEVNFVKTGTHYIWIRGYGQDGNSDSCHAGINGEAVVSGHRFWGFGTSYGWVNTTNYDPPRRTVEVPSTGVHTINVWMREDGCVVDKIVLTTNPDFSPTSEGPEESHRGPRMKAYNPVPEDGAIYLDTWVNLAWSAGETAVSHDVYFGESLDDVNDGVADTFLGNQGETFLIVGFPGFAYPDGLVPGTTYYWRVDEVEADGITIYKGYVWSFTVPPKTAYDPDPADGAELVDLEPRLSWTLGFGAKLHTVYLGESYDEVESATVGVPTGSASYSPGRLKMAKTYYWRVDEFDGFATYKGQVWSFTTLGAVSGPNPSDGAVGVKTSQILTWTAGGVAASHEVYFGMDEATVANATKASPEYKGSKALGDESYDPGLLTLSTTYYWRIDEVNAPNPDSPWIGNVWSFTTGNYFTVEDFEDYTDDDTAGQAIWQNWIDGFGVPDNGAQVGYLLPPYAEQTIVNSGGQSMPLFYNNTAGVTNSEAMLTLTAPRDWTAEGVAELSLWFHGLPASVGSFVEGPAGTYTMTAAGIDIWDLADEMHYAYKMLSGIGSMSVKVESLQNTDPFAKAGVMIRNSLDPDSANVALLLTPENGVRFQYRQIAGDITDREFDDTLVAPYWVKLERDLGSGFRGYTSPDGVNWQQLTLRPSVTMNSDVYIGLALTSHVAGVTCEAVFSNVTTTGNISGQWTNQDIGIISNAAEPLYVAVSNAAGSPAIVANDDPAAATIDAWTEWRVPLQAFADQGINLGNVDKIAIGLGSQSGMAAPGGTGTMYIDDIRLYQP